MTKTPDAQLLDNHCCHFEQKGEMRNAIKGDWGGGREFKIRLPKSKTKNSHTMQSGKRTMPSAATMTADDSVTHAMRLLNYEHFTQLWEFLKHMSRVVQL